MAWFKKKHDPISERARELKKQIADLEGQIRKLNARPSNAGIERAMEPPKNLPFTANPSGPASPPDSGHSSAFSSATPSLPPSISRHAPPRPAVPPISPPTPGPKLRSTARPKSPTVFLPKQEPPPEPEFPAPDDPIFEEVGQNPFRAGAGPLPPETRNHLDIRRNDLVSMWRRFKTNFRGPATSNPKLVNYLAAGSIQGLRPLRYERRVARNRFLVLVVILIVVLWGIVALIFFR